MFCAAVITTFLSALTAFAPPAYTRTGHIYDTNEIDVWDKKFDPRVCLEAPFLKYLDDFFYRNADKEIEPDSYDSRGEGLLSYTAFTQWRDLNDILNESQVDPSCLRDVWLEAIQERKECQITGKVNLDTFLRLNIRIDMILSDVSDVLESILNDDTETYHRKQFELLSSGNEFITYSQLIEWKDIKEMIRNKEITEEQIRCLWLKLPREIIRPYTVKNHNNHEIISGEGITVNSFLVFIASIIDLQPDNLNK